MEEDEQPFIGSEALARGTLNRHQLRTLYRAVMPNVYLPKRVTPSLRHRVPAAWLWSHREGVVAGLAASAMHGSGWIDDDSPVELIWPNARAPRGVVTRNQTLLDDEYQALRRLPVTTPERTAFDLGRRRSVGSAVARLDALARATGFKAEAVADLAGRHKKTRGLRQLETALDLVDAGAQSPKETWLRLLLISAGLPRPQTQIAVLGGDGFPFAYLDMGWEDVMVAAEYDGDQHRADRDQYVKDIRRLERLQRLGWIVVRVIAEDHPADIVRRVRDARDSRR